MPSNAELPALSISWFIVSLPFASGFLASVALTALLIRIGSKKQWVAVPRQDRWNKRTVVKFGGVPVLLAFSLAVFLRPVTRETLMLLLLTLGMGLVGLVDDVFGLGPKSKLLGQFSLAGLAVFSGILHPLSAHFWFDALFTVFWIVGITNALNLLDNMDGLAAGITLIGLIQIALLAGPGTAIGGFALCMLVAIAGFLPFNLNPARVFMGDTGALAAGFFLACTSVKAAAHLSSLGSVLFVPCLVLFVPVFDTLLVSVTRRLNGRPISRGARDHTSHRLVLVGLSERRAVALLFLIAAVAGVMAFLWKSAWWADLGAGIVALFLIGAALFWIYLAELQLPSTWLSAADGEIRAVPEFLQQLAKRITGILIDAALIILGLYFAYVLRFQRLDEALWGRFLFAAALALPVKMGLLIAFGAYREGWSVTEKRHLSPILETSAVAAVLLAGASAILPQTKTLGWPIIWIDAFVTTVLLSLGRASSHILDRVLVRTRLWSARGRSSLPDTGQVPQDMARSQPMEMEPASEIVSRSPETTNGKLKVVRIIGRLNVGGAARLACLLQEKLAQDFETHLIIGSLAEGEQDMSYLLSSQRTVFRLRQMSREVDFWSDVVAFWRIWYFLQKVRPDVVHTHTAKAGALGRLASWLAGVPVIVHTYHGHVFHGYFGALQSKAVLMIERLLGRLSTQIIAISDSQLQELSTKYRVAPLAKFSVIQDGIALDRFSQARRSQNRAQMGIAPDDFVVVWAGRMVPVKDVHLLARVIRAAFERGSQMRFLLVGDGTERQHLEEQIRGCANAELLGWRMDIEQIWSVADVALLTSWSEGTPTSLIEAMACGLPFVATRVGGVPDLAVPPLCELPMGMGYAAANGFLATRTHEALLYCLEHIVASPRSAKQMGTVGRAFVVDRFSMHRAVNETKLLYYNLVAKRCKGATQALSQESATHAGDLF